MIRHVSAEKRALPDGSAGWLVIREIDNDEHPGGVEVNGCLFSEDAISLRCAEYDMDPDDPYAVVDLLLHESLVDDGPAVPHLLTTGTVAEARAAHLADVERVKAKHRAKAPRRKTAEALAAPVDPHVDPVIDMVAADHGPIDPQVHALVRDQVDAARAQLSRRQGRPGGQRPDLLTRLQAAKAADDRKA